MKKVYRDKRVSLLILSILVSLYSFICMTKYCFSSSMVYIVDEGYMTKFETGTIISAFWMVYASMQIVGGIIADKFSPQRFITFGMVGAGIANLAVFFFYESYVATIIIWSLNAAVQCAVWPSCFKLVSTMIAPEHRSNGMMIITLSTPVGTLLSYAVAAIIDRWQTGFLVSSVGLFVFAAVWELVSGYASRFAKEEALPQNSSVSKSASSTAIGEKVTFAKLIFSSGLIFVLIVAFIRMFINQIQTLMPTMINESYESVAPNVATLLSLIVLSCSALGPMIASPLSKVIRNEMVACVLLLGVMIPLGGVALFLGKISYWPIIAAVSVMTLLSNAASFFISTLIAFRFNKWGKGATAAGLINAFSAYGVVGSNFIFTLIAEKLGWFTVTVTIVALIAAAFILCAVNIPIWTRFEKKL